MTDFPNRTFKRSIINPGRFSPTDELVDSHVHTFLANAAVGALVAGTAGYSTAVFDCQNYYPIQIIPSTNADVALSDVDSDEYYIEWFVETDRNPPTGVTKFAWLVGSSSASTPTASNTQVIRSYVYNPNHTSYAHNFAQGHKHVTPLPVRLPGRYLTVGFIANAACTALQTPTLTVELFRRNYIGSKLTVQGYS